MSLTIPVDEAQVKLKELIEKLAHGEEVILTENHVPVAKLVGAASHARTAARSRAW